MANRVIREPSRQLPIRGEADIVVVGGGPAGVCASLAASRHGAKVILIERFPFVGGMSTLIPISSWPVISAVETGELEQSYGGIPSEIVERLKKLDSIELRIFQGVEGVDYLFPYPGENCSICTAKWYLYDPEVLKHLLFVMLEDASVEVWVNCFAVDPVVRDNVIEAVVIENKTQREAVIGEVIVDATASADLAAKAGAPFEIGRASDGLVMAPATSWRMAGVDTDRLHLEEVVRLYEEKRSKGELDVPHRGLVIFILDKGIVRIYGTRVQNINPLDPRSAAHGEREMRRQIIDIVAFLKKEVPAFRNSWLMDTGVCMGTFDTRRIKGDYVLTEEDILTGKKFEDVIATGTYKIDIHDPTSDRNIFRHVKGTWYSIPYRCLLPQGLDNLLVAGDCISGTWEAFAAYSVQPIAMLTGQAAGTAAHLSVKEQVRPRNLSVSLLQNILRNDGVFLG